MDRMGTVGREPSPPRARRRAVRPIRWRGARARARASPETNQGRHERQLRGGARHRRGAARGENHRGCMSTTRGSDGSYPTRASNRRRRGIGPSSPPSSSSSVAGVGRRRLPPGIGRRIEGSLEAEDARDEHDDSSMDRCISRRLARRRPSASLAGRFSTTTATSALRSAARAGHGSSTSRNERGRGRGRGASSARAREGGDARERTEASAAPCASVAADQGRVSTPVGVAPIRVIRVESSGFESERSQLWV